MTYFLEAYYSSTLDDGVGGLLGSMMLLEDGKPADPGLWTDWINALERSSQTDVDQSSADGEGVTSELP